MKSKITEKGLAWTVDSAGTGSWHIGELPDPRSIDVANLHGIDITDQRARQFSPGDLEKFDLILAMDQSNFQNILRLSTNEDQKEKVQMILNYSYPGQNRAVPDPYWDDNGFASVFEMLEQACEAIIEQHR